MPCNVCIPCMHAWMSNCISMYVDVWECKSMNSVEVNVYVCVYEKENHIARIRNEVSLGRTLSVHRRMRRAALSVAPLTAKPPFELCGRRRQHISILQDAMEAGCCNVMCQIYSSIAFSTPPPPSFCSRFSELSKSIWESRDLAKNLHDTWGFPIFFLAHKRDSVTLLLVQRFKVETLRVCLRCV